MRWRKRTILEKPCLSVRWTMTRTEFFGFVDENFWIFQRKFLDLSTIFFGFVSVGVRFSGENYNDNDEDDKDAKDKEKQ